MEVKDNQARFEEGFEEEDHGVLRSLPSAFEYVIHIIKNTHSQGGVGGGFTRGTIPFDIFIGFGISQTLSTCSTRMIVWF